MKEIKSEIRLYGSPILRKKAKPVKSVTAEEKKVFEKMIEAMRQESGIGLAGPQIGIDKQLIVVEIGNKLLMLANPKIIKQDGCDILEEGCLSFPELTIKIKRPKSVKISCLNQENCKIELEADDIVARALLHEIDHLKGKLIIDYATFMDKIRLRKKLKEIKKKSKNNSN